MKKLLLALLLVLPLVSIGQKIQNSQISTADSLCNAAKGLFEKKQLEEAIELYTKSDIIYRRELKDDDTLRLRATKNIVQCYIEYSKVEREKGNIGKATELINKAEKIQIENFGKKNQIYSDILTSKGHISISEKKYDNAINYGTEAANICKSLYGKNNEKYAKKLYFLAYFHSSAGNSNENIKYGEAAIAAFRGANYINELNYAWALNNQAIAYLNKGLPLKAAELIKEAVPIFREKKEEKDTTYAKIINNAAVIYAAVKNNKEAVLLGEEALNIANKTKKYDSYIYFKCINDLAVFYSNLGNEKKAIKLLTSHLEAFKKQYGEKHPRLTTIRNNLASFYSESGDYISALGLYNKNLEFYIDSKTYDNVGYALCLTNMATCMQELGDIHTAFKFTEEAEIIYRKHLGIEHPNYLSLSMNLAGYYNALGNTPKAIEIITDIEPVVKKVHGENSFTYLWLLNDLASYYSYIANHKSAIKICQKGISNAKTTLNENKALHAVMLNNLAGFHNSNGNTKEAIKISKDVLSIRKNILGEKHPDYALTLNNIGSYYYEIGDIEKALDYFADALLIQSKTSIIGYINTLENIAQCFFDIGDTKTAIEYTKDVLKEKSKIYGKKHKEYAHSLYNLSSCSLAAGDTTNATSVFLELFDIRSNIIREYFSGITAREREIYWQENATFFEEDMPFIAHYLGHQKLINAAYDASLLTKGVLLNTELSMDKLLQESGDSTIIAQYSKLKEQRSLLNRYYNIPIANRKINTDSLEQSINKQERQLIKSSKIYGDYTHNMSITWKEIQKNLADNDIAIEFKQFETHSLKDIQYVAFILKKEYSSPKMIALFTQKELDNIKETAIYNSDCLSKKIWGVLAPELQGVNNIYFAPDGGLHRIAIETLPFENQYINDKYNLYRLSSTRQLAIKQEKTSIKNVALYGGLLYDADTLDLAQENRKYTATRSDNPNHIFPITLRGNASYLPSTQYEVDTINTLLKQTNKITVECYTGIKGTEESLKSLSGKDINLLHIATHGFYWSPEKAHWMKHDKAFLNQNDNTSIEDKALSRSGLLLSGANHALNGTMMQTINDGILTAKELANIDFRKLRLAVLSACQTGLGDITGEGVFGLQRGFKKAGAKTLLMTLWKVDDKATSLLMSEFYRNLVSGESTYNALGKAQKYLRNYEIETNDANGKRKIYSDPHYWAAFILLDAN